MKLRRNKNVSGQIRKKERCSNEIERIYILLTCKYCSMRMIYVIDFIYFVISITDI